MAGAPQSGVKRVLAWALALGALAFVARAVPMRDRCDDPFADAAAPQATPIPKVPVSRGAGPGPCVAHRPTGDAPLDAAACAKLRCEPGLITTFEGARLGPLAALLALYFVGTLAWAARYRALLALARVRVGLVEAWRITLEAQAGGILLPGGIGGDALRVGFVVGKGATLTTVVAAVLLDRAIGLATLAGLAAAIAGAVGEGSLGAMTIVLGAFPLALAAGLTLARFGPLSRASIFTKGPLARVARPVLDYLGDPRAPRAIATAIGFSVVVSATQLLVIRGLVSALGGVPLLERWIYLGTTMSFLVAAVPALPGAWGTSDASYVFFFGKAGLAASTALAASLMYRLFWYSSGGVGAVLYLLRQHSATPPPTSGQPHASESDHPAPRTP